MKEKSDPQGRETLYHYKLVHSINILHSGTGEWWRSIYKLPSLYKYYVFVLPIITHWQHLWKLHHVDFELDSVLCRVLSDFSYSILTPPTVDVNVVCLCKTLGGPLDSSIMDGPLIAFRS